MKSRLKCFFLCLIFLGQEQLRSQHIIPTPATNDPSVHVCAASSVRAQYRGVERNPPFVKDNFDVQVRKLGFGHESGSDSLDIVKEKAWELKLEYNGPWQETLPAYKNDPDSVQLRNLYPANLTQNFTPMDNSLAMNSTGVIVSVVNANYSVINEQGSVVFTQTFKSLAAKPALNGRYYDPRVIFDSQQGRFVMMILHGSDPQNSRVLMFVSQSDNPLGGWFVYELSGNPFNDDTWSDFPNLATSNDEIIITTNRFNSQNRFVQACVFQISKNEAYHNKTLNPRIWQGITGADGKYPFNLVPVPYGHKGNYGPGIYFINTSTHGAENIHLFQITNTLDNNPQLLNYSIGSAAYSAPADAYQKDSEKILDVGDCRVISAFYLNGLIHFTFNAGGDNGYSGIRYNRLDVESRVNISTDIRSGAAVDYAYGSTASFSKYENNKAVVVAYVFSGREYYPSIGYAYVDDQMNIYPKPPVILGEGPANMVNADRERWGDYTTLVRNHESKNPSVWLAASRGRADGKYQNYVAEIGGDEDTLQYSDEIRDIRLFPNPASNRINIRFMLEKNMPVEILLYDARGSEVAPFFSDVLGKGLNELSFSGESLTQGIYFVRIMSGVKVIKSEKIVVAR